MENATVSFFVKRNLVSGGVISLSVPVRLLEEMQRLNCLDSVLSSTIAMAGVSLSEDLSTNGTGITTWNFATTSSDGKTMTAGS